jgi:outer membrane protein insertion porin family
LKEEQFEDDKERLAEFYRDKGYIDFDIQDVKFEYPTPHSMIIKFDVFEGNPYKVGAVSFKGAPMFPTNKVDQMMRLKVGATFKPKDLEKDVERVEDFYGAKGHIDVTEGSGNLRVSKIPNVEKGTMDLEYQVNEGQKSYIEKIEIRGNSKTKDRVIRRELAVSPGETFDMVRVKVSKQRLEGLQYFEKVDLKPEPTDIAPNRKNLIVAVEEKSTGNVGIGAGFNSIENLMGYVDVSQGNFDLFNPPTFTGGGQHARLHLALGTQSRDALVSFIEPWFLDRRLTLGVDLYHRWLDYESLNSLYTETRTGGRLSLEKDLWQNRNILKGSVSYTLEDVGIDLDPSLHPDEYTWVPFPGQPGYYLDTIPRNAPLALLQQGGHVLLSRVGASLAFDTRNNFLLPDKGQRTELLGEVTGGPFGGDKSFYKLELRNACYFRGLAKGHILELTGTAGVGKAFGNTDDVPFYDRYYLGGLYTLRGYRYRDIGPKELVNGTELEPVGGDTYWFGSAEYSIPIIERVRLAAFYDIGMVYPKAFSFSPAHFINPSTGQTISTGTYADNWGIGIRLSLPISPYPLRLDYGLPVTHDPSVSKAGRFQFGIGFTHQY